MAKKTRKSRKPRLLLKELQKTMDHIFGGRITLIDASKEKPRRKAGAK